MNNLRLLCLVVNGCRGSARRHRYKYSITARWKFCSRFINSKLNAQYLPSYRLICQTKYIGSLFRYFEVGPYVCDIVVKKFTFAISSPGEFLLLQSKVNRDSKWTVVNPLYIIKSSIKSALFRLSSRVQRFTSFNLSRYSLSRTSFIIGIYPLRRYSRLIIIIELLVWNLIFITH